MLSQPFNIERAYKKEIEIILTRACKYRRGCNSFKLSVGLAIKKKFMVRLMVLWNGVPGRVVDAHHLKRSKVETGFEQPDLVRDVPAHGRRDVD